MGSGRFELVWLLGPLWTGDSVAREWECGMVDCLLKLEEGMRL